MSYRVDHLLTLVKADPRLRLDLRLMAELVNLSVPHLCHLFKNETGIPAGRSVKLAKMEHSADLLTGTFLSVKQIRFNAGFSDESHFVRDFKKIYGMTPTEYRKSGRVSTTRESPGKDEEARANSERAKTKGERPKAGDHKDGS
jgi:AraC-like DNA-binding protein